MESIIPPQSVRIHQFHFHASRGDAVTQQMLFIQKSLAEIGIEGKIFAKKIKGGAIPGIVPFARHFHWDADLLLIHHSFGNPAIGELSQLEVPKAVVYHNVTPARFFRHDPYLYQQSLEGRAQLKQLKKFCVRAFSDSQYNGEELIELGFKEPRIRPLMDISTMQKIAKVTTQKKAKQLLFVGRVAPHKNQAYLIQIFFFLKKLLTQGSKLTLIGTGDRVYTNYLKLLRRQLNLEDSVEMPGHVSDSALSEYYASSDGFICVSQHEGFCVPLIEAMRNSLPVFAIPRTAVTETLGDAGVHLSEIEEAEPHAGVIASVLKSPSAVSKVLQSQSRRLEILASVQKAGKVQVEITQLIREMREFPQLTMRTFAPSAW